MREGLRFPEEGKIAPPKPNRPFHFLPPLTDENTLFSRAGQSRPMRKGLCPIPTKTRRRQIRGNAGRLLG